MAQNMGPITVAAVCLAVSAGSAVGQSDIDATNKFCWQENAGWMNWRDANGGQQGVRDRMTFLAGFIWCENLGWVSVGSGTPANGQSYSNASGADFGVNIAPGGQLSGYAWGENVGWINFSGGALATPPVPAMLDAAASRFRGYAWGENIGWVNLDDAAKYVQRACYANCDGSTILPILNVNDFTCFLNKYAQGDPYANCDRSSIVPVLNVNDFTCFLNRYAQGCP